MVVCLGAILEIFKSISGDLGPVVAVILFMVGGFSFIGYKALNMFNGMVDKSLQIARVSVDNINEVKISLDNLKRDIYLLSMTANSVVSNSTQSNSVVTTTSGKNNRVKIITSREEVDK